MSSFRHGVRITCWRGGGNEKDDSQTKETAVAKGRKSYTVEKKLSIITKCNQNGGNVAKTARDCNIPHGCLHQWLKQREELEAISISTDISKEEA